MSLTLVFITVSVFGLGLLYMVMYFYVAVNTEHKVYSFFNFSSVFSRFLDLIE